MSENTAGKTPHITRGDSQEDLMKAGTKYQCTLYTLIQYYTPILTKKNTKLNLNMQKSLFYGVIRLLWGCVAAAESAKLDCVTAQRKIK